MLQKLEQGKLRPQTPEKYRLSGVLKTQTSAKLTTLSKVRTDQPVTVVETPSLSCMLFRI